MAKTRRGRGEGGIEQLPSGKFRAVVSLGTDAATGKRERVKKTFDAKKEALEWRAEQTALVRSGGLSASGRMTLAEWVGRWRVQKDTQVEAATRKWYGERIEKHILPRLGTRRLNQIDAEAVRDWYAKMGRDAVPAGQQRRAGSALRTILGDAAAAGLVGYNAAKRVKLPRHRAKEAHSLTHDQSRAALARVGPDWFGALVRLGFDAGMRPGELLGLHWRDVDLEGGAVKVLWAVDGKAVPIALKPPKTDRGRRTILVARPTVDALRPLKAAQDTKPGKNPTGLVFPGRFGGLRDPHNVSGQRWKPLLKAAGVPACGLYTLRHTSATLLLANGVNIKVVSERLGHADISTTLRFYAHALPSLQSHAAEVAAKLFG